MTGLVYLFPPLTGLIAFFTGTGERTRWHGLQCVVLGFLWPAGLYAGALVSPAMTQLIGLAGTGVWLTFGFGAAFGRDPSIPLLGPVLRAWAQANPKELP
jgi:hypothetical protein